MIECIDGAPEGLPESMAVGDVHAKDHEEVLRPAVDAAILGGREVRIVFEIGLDFGPYWAGAAWHDMAHGPAHLSEWECCAVVTDGDRAERGAKAFGWMMGGRLRVFGTGELAAAPARAAGYE